MLAQLYELAEKDYILGMKYREIAEKYNVSVETVRSWKKRHNWERDKPVKKGAPVAPKTKKGCTLKEEVQEPVEELTDKEQLFCYHYVRTWNATQAALKAGYAPNNRSSANVLGCRLLASAKIKAEVNRLKGLLTQEIHIDALDVLQQYIKIAFADIGDYLEFNGYSVKLNNSLELDTSVLSEVKEGKEGVSVKLVDKMKALEKLELYFDLLPDQWKRKIESEKLEIERKKLAVIESKDKPPNKPSVQPYIDALKGTLAEVWDDEGE